MPTPGTPNLRRRHALGLAAAGLLTPPAFARQARAATVELPFENGTRPIVTYPGKRPLILLTSRPPQLETPMAAYGEALLTPNDAFFVRYHLAGLPDSIDPDTFKLEIKGHVATPISMSLADIKSLGSTNLVAVNQCSGNGRGFFQPRVAGGQAGNGLMGNARWTGVPLKTILAKAGIKPGAVQIRFDGLDGPVMGTTPDFAKSLPLDVANNGDVMLAWAMNGQDLPFLNGYPLRLIVPGYFGTYWVKHLNEITVLDKPLDNFWMATAYRIPDNDCNCVTPGTPPAKTIPINKMKVRSFITSIQPGAALKPGPTTLTGIAFDGGSGIKAVEVSVDGNSWTPATLGQDMGRFAFRPWSAPVTLPAGTLSLKVRATANDGATQPVDQPWNPSGYLRNLIETTKVQVA